MSDATKPEVNKTEAATARYKAAVTGLAKNDAEIEAARALLAKLQAERPKIVGEVHSAAIELLTTLGGAAPPDIFKQPLVGK